MVRTRKFNLKMYKHPDDTILEYGLQFLKNIRLQIYKQYLNIIDAPFK